MKIKKGDQVLVTVGKDRGKTGQVEKVWNKEGRVLLPGLNQYKKHKKATTGGQKGELLTISRPIPVANVAFMCPKCKLQTRLGYQINNGKKVRVCRKCDQII